MLLNFFCSFMIVAEVKGQQTETLLAGSLAKALCCILFLKNKNVNISQKRLCISVYTRVEPQDVKYHLAESIFFFNLLLNCIDFEELLILFLPFYSRTVFILFSHCP